MSEIKGQILGIVLVLAIFGAVAAVMVTLFRNTATEIEEKVSANIESVLLAKNTNTVDADLTF